MLKFSSHNIKKKKRIFQINNDAKGKNLNIRVIPSNKKPGGKSTAAISTTTNATVVSDAATAIATTAITATLQKNKSVHKTAHRNKSMKRVPSLRYGTWLKRWDQLMYECVFLCVRYIFFIYLFSNSCFLLSLFLSPLFSSIHLCNFSFF